MRKIWIVLCVTTLLLGGCTERNAPITEVTAPTEPQEQTLTLNLITEKRVTRKDGTPLSHTVYTYDQRGLILTCVYTDHSIPSQSFQRHYHYNDHGHLVSTTQIVDGEEIVMGEAYEYTYNADGTIASIGGFFGPDTSIQFAYNPQGQLVEASTDYFNGETTWYYRYKYDDTGKLIKSTLNIPKGPQTSAYSNYYEYFYDAQGQLNRISGHYNYSCEYDQYGNLIRENDFYYTYSAPDGVIIGMRDVNQPNMDYRYDPQGRLIRCESTEHYGVIQQYTYTSVEIHPAQLGMSRIFYSNTNDHPGPEHYHDKYLYSLLPLPMIPW